ncbi:nucleoside-diphosphate-sugar epimerase [Mollisia scopiformis]|uniref:UDP-glucuronic acid decarboxylase 1 n=1 Tax=Mollisia scopiformis TaxID=149040 RepID=A0A132B782_MOLSC|nr:nucleoside-diphosphate-sugar epimerase [Mollisia scopiformis]KUJ07537.1 nucleoside-diphosphate-sugar epimerase [Mollisia scopiformis]
MNPCTTSHLVLPTEVSTRHKQILRYRKQQRCLEKYILKLENYPTRNSCLSCRDMKILVAGGAGFLGSNLVNHLLKEGHDVVLLDSFIVGLESSINHLVDLPNLTVLRHDITKPLKDLRVDQIYHLACPASPKHYQRDPIKTLQTCYIGTENMLKCALRCNARMLFSSTSEIYGDSLVSPQPESYFGNVNSYGPRSCYDEGKRVAESLCYAYQHMYKLDVRIARIFNAYGPGMPASDGRVVSNFIAAAINGQPLNITGDGSAVRCFQYVTDCISGLTKLMASDYSQPINIGNDRLCRVDELAHVVMEVATKNGILGLDKRITYSERPVDDPDHRQPDIRLAREVLGWSPVVSLEDGIQKTFEWLLSIQGTSLRGKVAKTGAGLVSLPS